MNLKLPVIKKMPPNRVLSMDEYVKFVEMNVRNIIDQKRERKRARKEKVNVRFLT